MNFSTSRFAALAPLLQDHAGRSPRRARRVRPAAGPDEAQLGGRHAGRNGLKDIHAQLGTADFWRLRLGIGHPGVRAEVIDYVLRKPAPEQREAIEKCIELSLGALDLVLDGNMERAMMKIHAKPPRPKPAPKPQREASNDDVTEPAP